MARRQTATTQAIPAMMKIATKLALLVAGFVISLVVCEIAVSVVRKSAFPFLNIFESDARLGVRLEANAKTKLRSRSGRITEVRTNALGFRGASWPKSDGTLLLGDSQMFGYGVQESKTTASLLAAKTGRPVLNAAIPTFGPTEYVALTRRFLPIYGPKTVIFVANIANDWYESRVPNTRRMTARDGWAMRAVPALAASEPLQFPGRRWLMSRSHLVFLTRAFGAHLSAKSFRPSSIAVRLLKDRKRLLQGTNGYASKLSPHLKTVIELCAQHGCRVIAATLPLDVQAHKGEWAKYREQPEDTSGLADLKTLSDTFLQEAQTLGAETVDLLPVLIAASPGAFLNDDYHMSPAGHLAVADAFHQAEAHLK